VNVLEGYLCSLVFRL